MRRRNAWPSRAQPIFWRATKWRSPHSSGPPPKAAPPLPFGAVLCWPRSSSSSPSPWSGGSSPLPAARASGCCGGKIRRGAAMTAETSLRFGYAEAARRDRPSRPRRVRSAGNDIGRERRRRDHDEPEGPDAAARRDSGQGPQGGRDLAGDRPSRAEGGRLRGGRRRAVGPPAGAFGQEKRVVKTIVVNNQKGGVGKTMLAVHLAWFLAEERGARVLFIDLDPQGNASYTLAAERTAGLSSSLLFGPG